MGLDFDTFIKTTDNNPDISDRDCTFKKVMKSS